MPIRGILFTALLTVVAACASDRAKDASVTRVIIDDGRYLTEKGIGVGKTVGALRAGYGTLCEMSGEGKTVWLAASAPGISFGADSLRTPLDSTVISQIWIIGNPARCGGG